MGVYAKLLRVPNVAVLLVATTVMRLPFAINSLAVLLFVREVTGSFASAGLTAGALALGAAFGAPAAARLVDRRGVAMLLPLAFGHAAALLAIWALGSAEAPAAVLAAIAVCAGATFPPGGAVLRSCWPELVGDAGLLRSAYAFDSVMIEVSFVTGPLLTAAVVALAGPAPALGVAAALVVAGTALFLAKLPRSVAPAPAPVHTGILGALTEPAIRVIALTTFPVGFCLGTIEVALPAFSDAEGDPALAGVLLALWSLGSGIGGLVFGARQASASLIDTYLAIALVFPLLCLPVAAASSPAVMALLAIVAGLPIAPLIASRNELVGRVARDGTSAESFTWLMTALVAGLAAGAAVAGSVAESQGWRAAVLVGVGFAVLGGAVAVARRRTLRIQPATG
jgi:MFS family permease